MKKKQAAIMKATLELVSIYGYQGITIAMIANNAQVGIGTFYRYFNNKDELFNSIFFEINEEVAIVCFKNYSEELSILERFRVLWFNMLDYYLDHPKERSFTQQYMSSPYMNDECIQEINRIFEPLTHFYFFGCQQGIFKRMPRSMSDSFWWATILDLARRQSAGELNLDSEMRELAIKAAWDTFRN